MEKITNIIYLRALFFSYYFIVHLFDIHALMYRYLYVNLVVEQKDLKL